MICSRLIKFPQNGCKGTGKKKDGASHHCQGRNDPGCRPVPVAVHNKKDTRAYKYMSCMLDKAHGCPEDAYVCLLNPWLNRFQFIDDWNQNKKWPYRKNSTADMNIQQYLVQNVHLGRLLLHCAKFMNPYTHLRQPRHSRMHRKD